MAKEKKIDAIVEEIVVEETVVDTVVETVEEVVVEQPKWDGVTSRDYVSLKYKK